MVQPLRRVARAGVRVRREPLAASVPCGGQEPVVGCGFLVVCGASAWAGEIGFSKPQDGWAVALFDRLGAYFSGSLWPHASIGDREFDTGLVGGRGIQWLLKWKLDFYIISGSQVGHTAEEFVV